MEATREQQQKDQKSKLNGSSTFYKAKVLKENARNEKREEDPRDSEPTEIEFSVRELQQRVTSFVETSLDGYMTYVRNHPVKAVMGAVSVGICIGAMARSMRPRFRRRTEP